MNCFAIAFGCFIFGVYILLDVFPHELGHKISAKRVLLKKGSTFKPTISWKKRRTDVGDIYFYTNNEVKFIGMSGVISCEITMTLTTILGLFISVMNLDYFMIESLCFFWTLYNIVIITIAILAFITKDYGNDFYVLYDVEKYKVAYTEKMEKENE